VASEVASLAAFGTLWIAQYVVLDRVLFRAAPTPIEAPNPAPAGGPADPAAQTEADTEADLHLAEAA
jgi:hypothetical protein